MKNKKAEVMIQVMIFLAIGAIIVLITVPAISNLWGKEKSWIAQLSISSRDYDGDGIINSDDECPCDKGDDENEGCPDDGTEMTKDACDTKFEERYT